MADFLVIGPDRGRLVGKDLETDIKVESQPRQPWYVVGTDSVPHRQIPYRPVKSAAIEEVPFQVLRQQLADRALPRTAGPVNRENRNIVRHKSYFNLYIVLRNNSKTLPSYRNR